MAEQVEGLTGLPHEADILCPWDHGHDLTDTGQVNMSVHCSHHSACVRMPESSDALHVCKLVCGRFSEWEKKRKELEEQGGDGELGPGSRAVYTRPPRSCQRTQGCCLPSRRLPQTRQAGTGPDRAEDGTSKSRVRNHAGWKNREISHDYWRKPEMVKGAVSREESAGHG